MKFKFSKSWCKYAADLEKDANVAAGVPDRKKSTRPPKRIYVCPDDVGFNLVGYKRRAHRKDWCYVLQTKNKRKVKP